MKALTHQNTFSTGEVDPELLRRDDTQMWSSAVARARNVQSMVQGGLRHCGGTWLESPLRNPLTAFTSFSVTAPNGGTAAYLTDGDAGTVFQSNAASGSNFVVAECTYADTAIVAVDVTDVLADVADDQVLAVRVRLDGGAWTQLALTDIRTSARTRRFAFAPKTEIVSDTAQIIVTSAGCGKVTIGSVTLWTAAAAPGDATLIPYKFNLEQQYTLAATAQNIDVFRNSDGAWLAAIAAPVSEAMLLRLAWSQRLDSLTLYHEDLPTQIIERQELETEWNIRAFPFENVPDYSFPDTNYDAPATGGTVTLHNQSGGTASVLTDGDRATTTAITINTLTGLDPADIANKLIQIDYGAVRGFSAVRLKNAVAAGGGGAQAICYVMHSQDGSSWTQLNYQSTAPSFAYEWRIDNVVRDFEMQGDFSARYVALVMRGANYTALGFNPFTIGEFEAVGRNAGIDAIQDLVFFDEDAGETYTLTLEGQTTEAISIDTATPANHAAAIKAALEALPNVEPGLVVTHKGSNNMRVQFSGGRNAKRQWDLMVATPNVTSLSVFINEVRDGRAPGEAVFSTARGWPRCGTFLQGRHVLAGFKSLPLHLAASVQGDITDMNIAIAAASGGLLWELDAASADGIVDLAPSRNLIVFTENEAYYNTQTVLSAQAAPDFRRIDQMGIEAGVTPAAIEGGILFVERGGHVLRQMGYTDAQASYATAAISTLSGHLLDRPRDMARRRPVPGDRGDLVFVVNSSGSVVLVTLQRAEEVTGFTRIDWRGQALAVSASDDGVVRFAMRRTLGGVTGNWLERHDRNLWLECAVKADGNGINQITTLGSHEGETVRVLADLGDEGLVEVVSGTVTIGGTASRIIAGFDLFADVIDLPVRMDERAGRLLARNKRVHSARIALRETSSVAVSANDGPLLDVALDTLEPAAGIETAQYGSAIGARPFTGTCNLQGLLGFAPEGQMRFTQIRPGSLTLQAVLKEMVV